MNRLVHSNKNNVQQAKSERGTVHFSYGVSMLAIMIIWVPLLVTPSDAHHYPLSQLLLSKPGAALAYSLATSSPFKFESSPMSLLSLHSSFPSLIPTPSNNGNHAENLSPKSLTAMNHLIQQQINSVSSSEGQKETEQIMNPNEAYALYRDEPRLKNQNYNDGSMLQEAIKDQMDYWEEPFTDKRNQWGKFNGAWGKRLGNWNKLQSAWGKRRPSTLVARSWNNLNGAWGRKRAKWNELNGMWGKRSPTWNKMASAWGKKKRSALVPHWNKLRGMWGKKRLPQSTTMITPRTEADIITRKPVVSIRDTIMLTTSTSSSLSPLE